MDENLLKIIEILRPITKVKNESEISHNTYNDGKRDAIDNVLDILKKYPSNIAIEKYRKEGDQRTLEDIKRFINIDMVPSDIIGTGDDFINSFKKRTMSL